MIGISPSLYQPSSSYSSRNNSLGSYSETIFFVLAIKKLFYPSKYVSKSSLYNSGAFSYTIRFFFLARPLRDSRLSIIFESLHKDTKTLFFDSKERSLNLLMS